MRKTLLATAVSAAFSLPAIGHAQTAPAAAPASPHTFTGNITLASEYLYRGIAQTRGRPALQGGFDYAHSSGFYAGLWGSNISWINDGTPGASASLELDIYGGYKGTITGDLGFDVGLLTYNYPGSGKTPTGWIRPDTTEVYGALTWKWLTLKYSHSTTPLFGWYNPVTMNKSRGSGYLELNASYDLGDGWGINGHIGHQRVNHYSRASYTDFKAGVTKDVGFGVVGAAYSTTNANDSCGAIAVAAATDGSNPYCFSKQSGGLDTYNAGKGRLLVTFTKTF